MGLILLSSDLPWRRKLVVVVVSSSTSMNMRGGGMGQTPACERDMGFKT